MSERIPPQSIEAEQAVLGALMLVNERFDEVSLIVSEADFYTVQHQLIYRAITALAKHGRPFDAVTLGEFLERKGLADKVGLSYLIDLASTTPSAANVTAYAQIVADNGTLRRVIEAGTTITELGFNKDGEEASTVLEQAMAEVFRLADAEDASEMLTPETALMEAVREIDLRSKNPDDLLGIATGIEEFDDLIGGLQDTDLIVLAARPGMGKTAFALNVADAAAEAGKPAGIWSMEMAGKQLTLRRIAAKARVDYKKVQRPHMLDIDEMEQMRRAIKKMETMPVYVDESPSLTPQRLASKIRRAKRQYGIGIAIIDYLQIVDMNRLVKELGNMNLAIGEVTRMLKKLAKELKIPIVLLSQLNRGLESRADKRPMLSDLRESGAIEQDADVVVFLYRDSYYDKNIMREDRAYQVAEIIVAKARAGGAGTVMALWRGEYQRFDNLADDSWLEAYNTRKADNGKQKSERGFQRGSTIGAGIERTAGD